MWKSIFIVFFISLINLSCNNNASNKQNLMENTSVNTYNYMPILQNDTNISYNFNGVYDCNVQIKFPNTKPKACILMLHGWNLGANEWCDSTDFCQKALEKGYILVIPDLQKCNYPLKIYEQTLEQYRKYPTITWFINDVIPNIQIKFGLLKQEDKNFVAGISTGGRGAILFAYYLPDIFCGAATLSGDFDITKMKNEFLYQAWFGDYNDYKERWEKECFVNDCKNYIVPTYIAHGEQDNIAPIEQSKMLRDSIQKNNPDINIECVFTKNASHNYHFWGEQTKGILEFFDGL